MSIGGCQSPTLYGSFLTWRNPPTYMHSQTLNVWCICLHLSLTYPNVGNEAVHRSSGIDFVELMSSWISCCLLGDSCTSTLVNHQWKSLYPWTAKTGKKLRFQPHNIWVITPTNEGCGFPMVMSRRFVISTTKTKENCSMPCWHWTCTLPELRPCFTWKWVNGTPEWPGDEANLEIISTIIFYLPWKLTANLPMKIVRNPNRKGSCSNHLVSGAFARGLKGVRYISAFSNLGSVLFGTVSTTPINSRLPWEPITFIFKAYNPYVRGLKPSYVHGFEVQGYKLGFPRG